MKLKSTASLIFLTSGWTVQEVYEKTPAALYRRLLESPLVSGEGKAELMRRKGESGDVE
jgi:hypothetical protein